MLEAFIGVFKELRLWPFVYSMVDLVPVPLFINKIFSQELQTKNNDLGLPIISILEVIFWGLVKFTE